MPKPRSKKIRVFRLIIVSALALWCLNSLHEIHQKKQRSLARTLSDHFDHHDDGHNHDGVVGMGVWTLPRRTDGSEPSPARGGLSTLRPDIDPAVGAMTRYTSPSRSEVALGVAPGCRRGARFTFPGTGTHANCLKAHARTPRRNSGCLGGAPGEDDGRFLDPIPSRSTPVTWTAKPPRPSQGSAPPSPSSSRPATAREPFFSRSTAKEGTSRRTSRGALTRPGLSSRCFVVAPDAAAATAAAAAGLPHVRPDCAGSCSPSVRRCCRDSRVGSRRAARGQRCCSARAEPLRNVPETRGRTLEGIPADLNALGAVVGMTIRPWDGRNTVNLVVPHLSSSLVVMHATEESTRLAKWLGRWRGDGSGADADVALSEKLMPAHDATRSSRAPPFGQPAEMLQGAQRRWFRRGRGARVAGEAVARRVVSNLYRCRGRIPTISCSRRRSKRRRVWCFETDPSATPTRTETARLSSRKIALGRSRAHCVT